MNFSKNPKKQHQTEKFQKSPFIFTQLGLVLALLVVYLALEFTAEKEIPILADVIPNDDPIFVTSDVPIIIIEKPKVKKESKIIRKLPLIDPIIVPDDTDIIKKVLDLPKDNDPPIDIINTIVEAPSDGIDIDEPLLFKIIEEAPIFPGCEGLDSLASRQCFTKKISKFVNKKFNANLAEGLNIVGKQKITVQFTIDKTGKVTDIKARAPHKKLEKEAIRVVQKLPQMTPGKQRKRPVGVKYTLPILFQVN